MEFGIFDHLDRNDRPLADYYEDRLRIAERYDRAGFYAYHLAEHHFTPLGMAPSPSIFLSAVAQRTTRLRFGALVYALPLHHPLRVMEEICMLDHLSRGRLEIGFGRGSSPFEVAYYGEDPGRAQQAYAESLDVILAALTNEVFRYEGAFGTSKDIPTQIEPLQRPHPPIWYGAHSPESAERAARKGLNVINNDIPTTTAACLGRFREVWRETQTGKPEPKMGFVRFVVVAATDEEALAIARRAYPRWLHSFNWLFRRHGRGPMLGERAPDFDTLMARGLGIAGSSQTIANCLSSQIAESGANYFVGQFAFGDLSLAEVTQSVDLFAADVMPKLRETARVAA